MKNLLILLISLFLFTAPTQYYYRNQPTSYGIDDWVDKYGYDIAMDYQEVVDDSLLNFFICADDLSLYPVCDSHQIGVFIPPYEIVVTNEVVYIDYAIDSVRRWKLKHTQDFVKATVYHELTHLYFYQNIKVLEFNDINIHPDFYKNGNDDVGVNALFIEEGLCEYINYESGEKYDKHRYDISTDKKITSIYHNFPDLILENNYYFLIYRYSEYFMRVVVDFLNDYYQRYNNINPVLDNKLSYADIIHVLVTNEPPDVMEIIDINKYLERLDISYVESL